MEQTDTIRQFSVGEVQVNVFPSFQPGCPVIYLNTFAAEISSVRGAVLEAGCPPFTLALITGFDWNRDLSPWPSEAIQRKGEDFAGRADEHLELLLREILPQTEDSLPGEIPWRGLAGYSMAGLFALYAACRTDRFSRIGSMSGSLWFPGFTDYVHEHARPGVPNRLYLSLGDRESRTRNPVLQKVEICTRDLASWYQEHGTETVFQMNPGNHFQNPAGRTAAGIAWLLKS